jgi:hypothetical protein
MGGLVGDANDYISITHGSTGYVQAKATTNGANSYVPDNTTQMTAGNLYTICYTWDITTEYHCIDTLAGDVACPTTTNWERCDNDTTIESFAAELDDAYLGEDDDNTSVGDLGTNDTYYDDFQVRSGYEG